jgi:septum formation protein
MKKIILASQSPRRKQLLTQLDVQFTVVPSYIEEKMNARLKPRSQAENLSLQKATTVAQKYKDAIIIAADTLVVIDNEILGKPKDVTDAKRMLKKLSGKTHVVITGYTIIDTETNKTITNSEESKVFMKKLSNKEIENYIKKENVFDKAGAYAIQGFGSLIIEKIEGDYSNVVGLPLFSMFHELKHFGISLL